MHCRPLIWTRTAKQLQLLDVVGAALGAGDNVVDFEVPGFEMRSTVRVPLALFRSFTSVAGHQVDKKAVST